VHGSSLEEVHFHEVGAADSIIDIVGFCAAMDILSIDAIWYGDIPFSHGSVSSQHGMLPLPSPAVSELAKGARVLMTDFEGELITPTALALLRSLGTQISHGKPPTTLRATGTGFGTRDYGFPSFTRAFILETVSSKGDFLAEIVCAIDDMDGQLYPYISEKLFAAGALDVYLTPLVMKKGRPGILLTALCEPQQEDFIKDVLFYETSTIGVRRHEVWREKLSREMKEIIIEGQPVRIKLSSYRGETVNIKPEFDDIRNIAESTGIPLKEVMKKALDEFEKRRGK
jgi:hypothetical protein